MEIGAPQPSFERLGDAVLVAYRISRPDDHFAVLRFNGVQDLTFGDPTDEALETHRLFSAGLQPYRFQEVHGEPDVPAGLRRWIITFHDDTLEVTARSAEVIVRATDAQSAAHAIAAARV
jgi:hypothetical protein